MLLRCAMNDGPVASMHVKNFTVCHCTMTAQAKQLCLYSSSCVRFAPVGIRL